MPIWPFTGDNTMHKSLVLSLICVISASNLFAGEDNSKTVLFVNLGMSAALAPEEFDETKKPGLNLGFELGYEITPKIVPGFFVSLDKFELSHIGSKLRGDLFAFCYGLNLRLYSMLRTTETRPYLTVGFGYVRFAGEASYSQNDGRGIDFNRWVGDETAELIAVGGGFDFYLSGNTSFFVDARCNLALADNEKIVFLPIRLGLAFY